LFVKLPDTLSVNFENSIVIESHVQCAAEEEPIHAIEDQQYFGENLPSVCEEHLAPIGNQVRLSLMASLCGIYTSDIAVQTRSKI